MITGRLRRDTPRRERPSLPWATAAVPHGGRGVDGGTGYPVALRGGVGLEEAVLIGG